MNTGQIFDKQLNEPLDEIILMFNEVIQDALRNKQIRTYNSFGDLGLDPETVSIEDIIAATPSYSMVQLDVYAGKPNLDVPGSGLLQIIRAGNSQSKAYVTFRNENISLYRMYNKYLTPNLQPWYALGWASQSIKSEIINNQLSNIRYFGMRFYFSRTESAKLMDKPIELGNNGFSIETYGFGSVNDTFSQIITENSTVSRKWHRVVDGANVGEWRSIPQLMTAENGEYRLKRLGDSYVDELNDFHIVTTKGAMRIDYTNDFGAGWRKTSDGIIEQWGMIDFPSSSNSVEIQFPIAFPNTCFFCIPIDVSSTGDVVSMSVTSTSRTTAVVQGTKFAGAIRWFAKGR